ncbi:condensation domain-containing protein [Ruminiclostridium cellulolyticum]|uniref:Alcohol acetyltransferase n=1 Tax=Ruminiclostridium cellulolyticum (strain ATCC 35319 / DSM 5812 / JCM 6584 / H10) TaxID=394503 RepID=B8I0J9_RUMCH|nr:condensation domain-containing protein [Ruminiclostridium cellulolyticum]ACL75574.1 Alcohol acetyltransferase [Ruminiclostridium cellulolyticum H10]
MKFKLKPCNNKINMSKLPPTTGSYFRKLKKSLAKYSGINKLNFSNTVNSSEIIPANAYDICNYVAKYKTANFQIQAIMKLDGRLDFDKLVKAVRLSVDAEPVMGCGFIKKCSPYWKRFDDIDNINFCSIVETDNTEEAVQHFLESPLHMDNAPMFMVKLIRSGTHDTLGVKINHVCSDGAGAKEYIQLLSDIYSRIDDGDMEYTPNPSVRNREDHKNLLCALGKESLDTSWNLHEQVALPTWRFHWKNKRMGDTRFVVCKLPYGHIDILKNYAKSRNATINDLILTAIFRAMFKISKPPYGVPMDIPITIDLRKYLPDHKAQAIRNLSGGVVIKIGRKPHEPFEGTLSRIVSLTKYFKNKHPSVASTRMADYIEKMSFRQICSYFKALSHVNELESLSPFSFVDVCSPVLSNMGLISKSLIRFGKNVVTDAYIIPPVVRAPGILLVASTYNGIITLAVGYYKPSVRKSTMEGLLNKIKDELVEGCRQQP